MPVDIVAGDARTVLQGIPDGHFHCAITSPPYWGLRDYGLEPTVWGKPAEPCEHEWGKPIAGRSQSGSLNGSTLDGTPPGQERRPQWSSAFCRRCNAWRGALGLEPTPELYVEHLVSVLREVRRTLRDDGTLWLNLGDSYNSQGGHTQVENDGRANRQARSDMKGAHAPGLKPKDLVGIPWRVAFALQADGWWLRSDIVWSKPNPMPESVRDRPTRSHEYLFLLTKSQRYYYDQDAIREPHTDPADIHRRIRKDGEYRHGKSQRGWMEGSEERADAAIAAGRNRRSVWTIAPQPYKGAHFAVFPEKLVEPCILAGCPKGGVVLDPFAGSGTVGVVAQRRGRSAILIDAKPEYCEMAMKRLVR